MVSWPPTTRRPPRTEDVVAARDRCIGERREELRAQGVEDAVVPVEARDRHEADRIEGGALGGVLLDAKPVPGSVEPELANPCGETAADLAAKVLEAMPPQAELRQRPLQQLHTLAIIHAAAIPSANGTPRGARALRPAARSVPRKPYASKMISNPCNSPGLVLADDRKVRQTRVPVRR